MISSQNFYKRRRRMTNNLIHGNICLHYAFLHSFFLPKDIAQFSEVSLPHDVIEVVIVDEN
jgi:hypothetical protein